MNISKEVEYKSNVLLTKNDKIDLVDTINKSKNETLVWIVSFGVLQFGLTILAKKFL